MVAQRYGLGESSPRPAGIEGAIALSSLVIKTCSSSTFPTGLAFCLRVMGDLKTSRKSPSYFSIPLGFVIVLAFPSRLCQLRTPWILSRKRLVAALAADGALFALIYCSLIELRFGVWPGLSLRIAVLLVIWSLSSYVIGRYSGRATSTSGHELHALNLVGRQLIATGFVLF